MPTAAEVLDRDFLSIRCRLIELAAALDRIDRADGSALGDERLAQVRRSLEILAGSLPSRADACKWSFHWPRMRNDGCGGITAETQRYFFSLRCVCGDFCPLTLHPSSLR